MTTLKQRKIELEQVRESHKANLAKECGVEGNPKLDMCYYLAWQYGHAHGFDEVASHFYDLVRLIKP